MIRVILESPYGGLLVERNIKYARECVRDSLSRGESPIASHLLYTQEGILDDNVPEERQWGIDAGLAWKSVAEKHVFYVDYGMSPGMEYGRKFATDNDIPIEIRKIREKTMISRGLELMRNRLDESLCWETLWKGITGQTLKKIDAKKLRVNNQGMVELQPKQPSAEGLEEYCKDAKSTPVPDNK